MITEAPPIASSAVHFLCEVVKGPVDTWHNLYVYGLDIVCACVAVPGHYLGSPTHHILFSMSCSPCLVPLVLYSWSCSLFPVLHVLFSWSFSPFPVLHVLLSSSLGLICQPQLSHVSTHPAMPTSTPAFLSLSQTLQFRLCAVNLVPLSQSSALRQGYTSEWDVTYGA